MAQHNCTCQQCGVTFYRSPAQLANGAGRYCSRACQWAAPPEARRHEGAHIARVCARCGKDFTVPRAWLARDGENAGRFCSRACRKPRLDEVVRRIDSMGYVAMRVNGTWTHEHRVVAEQMLGRPLAKNEVVHHKDHNRTNNDPSNLDVMIRGQHQSMHRKERFVLDAGAWGEGREHCVRCGTTEFRHKARGLCISCYCRERTLARNPDALTRPHRHR